MSMDHVKYPKTPHFLWSESLQNDDRRIDSLDKFIGQQIVVSEKLDGENTGMTSQRCHARSLDSKHHPSRNLVKQLHATISPQIPDGWKLFGENVYAKHTVFYEKLTAYFYLFSIWDESQRCLSWKDTEEWAEILGVKTVPVLYQGIWDETKIKSCWSGKSFFGGSQEGYVVRLASGFSLEDFPLSIGKFVSAEFKNNMSDVHWAQTEVIPNLMETK